MRPHTTTAHGGRNITVDRISREFLGTTPGNPQGNGHDRTSRETPSVYRRFRALNHDRPEVRARPGFRRDRTRRPHTRIVAGLVTATALMVPHKAEAHHAKGCNTKACDARVGHKQAREKKKRVVRPYRSTLLRIATCESGRRWHINTGNGFYGGLQFTLSSWHAVGGRGYPHHHGRLEQMYRAVKLMRIQGWGAWPVCSR